MVNTTKGYTMTNPSIVMNNQGNVVSIWTGGSAVDSAGVFMQQYTISSSQETSDGFYAQGDPNDPDQAHTTPSSAPPVAIVPPGGGPPGVNGGPMQPFGTSGAGDPGGRPMLRWMAGQNRPHHTQHGHGHHGAGRSPRHDGSHRTSRPGHGFSTSFRDPVIGG
jgi:hypothetical protein